MAKEVAKQEPQKNQEVQPRVDQTKKGETKSGKIKIMDFTKKSTGLKDKNGKDIYEGDVLKVDMCIRNKWTEGVTLKVVYYCSSTTTVSGFRFESEDGNWDYQAPLKDTEVV